MMWLVQLVARLLDGRGKRAARQRAEVRAAALRRQLFRLELEATADRLAAAWDAWNAAEKDEEETRFALMLAARNTFMALWRLSYAVGAPLCAIPEKARKALTHLEAVHALPVPGPAERRHEMQ